MQGPKVGVRITLNRSGLEMFQRTVEGIMADKRMSALLNSGWQLY